MTRNDMTDFLSGTKAYPALVERLRANWPSAFPRDATQIRPLSRGVATQIAGNWGCSVAFIRGVLGVWKTSPAYCAAVSRRIGPIDLQGAATSDPIGAVTHRIHANILAMQGTGTAAGGTAAVAQPRHPQAARVPVTLIGRPLLAVGRGEHIRAIRRALAAAGIVAQVYDLWPMPPSIEPPFEPPTPDLRASMVEEIGGGIRIFHLNGDELASGLELIEQRQPGILAKGYNIVFPAWELPIYPRQWAQQIDRFDEVWSASRFVDAALRQAVRIPVVHIPNACQPQAPMIFGRDYFDLPEKAFLILFAFDLGSYTSRKNPWATIETFRRLVAARPESTAHLVVKINRSHLNLSIARSIQSKIAGFAERVTIIDRLFTDREIKNLIGCCDCFLSLHRSEGFGRGPAEAMFLGKPAIATGWSGNMDYMNPAVSFPVGFDLVPLQDGDYLHWENQVWAEPRVEEAVRILVDLIDRPRLGRVIGNRARSYMRRKYSDKALGCRYAQRFGEILASASLPGGDHPAPKAADVVAAA